MDNGEDIGRTIETLEGFLSYSAKMGVIPELHAPYSKIRTMVLPGSIPLETVAKVCTWLQNFPRLGVELSWWTNAVRKGSCGR